MGIKGLKNVIARYSPDSTSTHTIEYFKNATIAVDSSILLYKYLCSRNSEDAHVVGFLNKILYFLNNEILPIFVFDGTPPEAKKETICKRVEQKQKLKNKIDNLKEKLNEHVVAESWISDDQEDQPSGSVPVEEESKAILDEVAVSAPSAEELSQEINRLSKQCVWVTKKHREDIRELLIVLGIPWIIAPGEAEATCAELQKRNIVQFTFTEDTDALTFGAENVVFTKNRSHELSICNLTKVRRGLELTHQEFVDFCILCGCDYTCTIPKIGPITALTMIRTHHNIETIIANLPDNRIPENFSYQGARLLFQTPKDLEISGGFHLKNSDYKKTLNAFLSTFGIAQYTIEGYITKLGVAYHRYGRYNKNKIHFKD